MNRRTAISRSKLRKVRRLEARREAKRAYRTPHNRARRALKAKQRENVKAWFTKQVNATLCDVFSRKNLRGEARLAKIGDVKVKARFV